MFDYGERSRTHDVYVKFWESLSDSNLKADQNFVDGIWSYFPVKFSGSDLHYKAISLDNKPFHEAST